MTKVKVDDIQMKTEEEKRRSFKNNMLTYMEEKCVRYILKSRVKDV